MTAQISPDQFLDPRWRLSNLYTIIDKKGKAVPFRPWGEQREFLENIHSRNLILKCRQRGFTTLMCLVQLDDCLFTPNTRAAFAQPPHEIERLVSRDPPADDQQDFFGLQGLVHLRHFRLPLED